MKSFTDICRLTQPALKKYMEEYLQSKNYNVVNEDGFLYAKGTLPVLLLAHLDTVHKEVPKEITEVDGKISSPQGIGGDDRCGVYIIMNLVKNFNCSVLLCEDEEIGGHGARKFTRATMNIAKENGEIEKVKYIDNLDVNYMVEFDRRGDKDAVFYRCDNKDFEKFITETTDFKTAYGSFSDISVIAPVAKIAAVNLSSGYYNAHMATEYVVREDMENTIEAAKLLITTQSEKFEYVEKKYSASKLYDDRFFDDYDDYGYGDYGYGYGYGYGSSKSYGNTYRNGKSNTKKSKSKSNIYCDFELELLVMYTDMDGEATEEVAYGTTKAECWAKFFLENPDVCFDMIVDYAWS